MTWRISTPMAGVQPIATSDSTQNHPLGTIVRAVDDSGALGEGEFIYLKGVANTVVGSLVSYNLAGTTTGLTTLSADTAALTKPLAVAMSANVASKYGWYQISGCATIKKTAVKVSPGVALYQSGTTGRVMSTAASQKQIQNCVSANSATVASATSTVLAVINRPSGPGVVI